MDKVPWKAVLTTAIDFSPGIQSLEGALVLL